MNSKQYEKFVQKRSTNSPILKNSIKSFLMGGSICIIGKLFFSVFQMIGISEKNGRSLVSISLVFLSCLLTGIGIYDKIAKRAGAGTLVPITGFANAMCSPAIDNKAEGFILGVGAKMFTIAGPVIVYGTVASVVYGLIYWITTLF